MLGCDYAVCFEIFDNWKLFKVNYRWVFDGFVTWDSNAHIMLIYRRILVFFPHLVKNKPLIHFKSFSFLKEGAHYMQKENKIDCTNLTPIFGILIKNVFFGIIRSILSQICYQEFWFETTIFQIFCFFLSVDVKIWYNEKHDHTCQVFSGDTQFFHKENVLQILKLSYKYLKIFKNLKKL